MSRVKALAGAILLSVALATTCTAQRVRNIPIHFHVHPSATASLSQLDEQVNQVNRVYTANGAPFRFQRQSVDRNPLRTGDLQDLNVFILPDFEENVGAYIREQDSILLDDDALPKSIWNSSGIVLIHEIGHWLGLSHTTEQSRSVPNCENQPPLISVRSKTCALTSTQIEEMIEQYNEFRSSGVVR